MTLHVRRSGQQRDLTRLTLFVKGLSGRGWRWGGGGAGWGGAALARVSECVEAVLRSEGGAVRVPEEQIAAATFEMAKLGLYTEPTCAQAAAAYRTLIQSGRIRPDEVTVIVLTATGVKATPSIAALLGLPA